MKKYTVLLLYPYYITGGGVGTYLSWVKAVDESSAVKAAQTEAFLAHYSEVTDGSEFGVLAVFKGHFSDLNPGAERCV